MYQWTRRSNGTTYVRKWNWQSRPPRFAHDSTQRARVVGIDSDPAPLVCFAYLRPQQWPLLATVVSAQSRVRCYPAKVNAVIGDWRRSRNGSDINVSDIYSLRSTLASRQAINDIHVPAAIILQTGFLAAFQGARARVSEEAVSRRKFMKLCICNTYSAMRPRGESGAR